MNLEDTTPGTKDGEQLFDGAAAHTWPPPPRS